MISQKDKKAIRALVNEIYDRYAEIDAQMQSAKSDAAVSVNEFAELVRQKGDAHSLFLGVCKTVSAMGAPDFFWQLHEEWDGREK